MAPEVEVIKIANLNLLIGSGVTGTGIDNPPSWGGDDPGVIPQVPEILPPGLEGIGGEMENLLFQ